MNWLWTIEMKYSLNIRVDDFHCNLSFHMRLCIVLHRLQTPSKQIHTWLIEANTKLLPFFLQTFGRNCLQHFEKIWCIWASLSLDDSFVRDSGLDVLLTLVSMYSLVHWRPVFKFEFVPCIQTFSKTRRLHFMRSALIWTTDIIEILTLRDTVMQTSRGKPVATETTAVRSRGLATLYGEIGLGELWHRQCLVDWWHQVITWTNGDLLSKCFCVILPRTISLELLQIANQNWTLRLHF